MVLWMVQGESLRRVPLITCLRLLFRLDCHTDTKFVDIEVLMMMMYRGK